MKFMILLSIEIEFRSLTFLLYSNASLLSLFSLSLRDHTINLIPSSDVMFDSAQNFFCFSLAATPTSFYFSTLMIS